MNSLNIVHLLFIINLIVPVKLHPLHSLLFRRRNQLTIAFENKLANNSKNAEMDRGRKAIPTLNKHTDKKFYQKCQNIHKKKLSNIKSCIDNSEPARPAHLRKNLKKKQMNEERYTTIERENRILLEKMSHIMQHNTLDNRNDSVQYGHSLNKSLRKRELQKITAENQAILQRIQTREPTYDHQVWENDAKLNEKYGQSIREFNDSPTMKHNRPESSLE